MKEPFFEQFKEFCITPGIDSGKASSYSRAIQYVCDYLNITKIDREAIAKLRNIENAIDDKNSVEYKSLLVFLTGRRQKSYLEGGFVKAALTYFFVFCRKINL